jgi:acetyl-CoA carboxylase biotin carboxylase subunit
LIAKIIARGRTRDEAIQKLLVALDECIIGGIKTNIDLHRRVLNHPDFRSGNVHTQMLETLLATPQSESSNEVPASANNGANGLAKSAPTAPLAVRQVTSALLE